MTELANVLKEQFIYFDALSNEDLNDYVDCSDIKERYKELCDKIHSAQIIATHLEAILDELEKYKQLIED